MCHIQAFHEFIPSIVHGLLLALLSTPVSLLYSVAAKKMALCELPLPSQDLSAAHFWCVFVIIVIAKALYSTKKDQYLGLWQRDDGIKA